LATVVVMNASEDYCELCDLPKSQCIHGRPPPVPQKAAAPSPKPRKSPAPRVRATPPPRVVNRRWTAPEALKPLILSVLEEAGGELDAEDLFLALEIAAEDRLLPGDLEKTPEGELRWRYAARRARIALIEEGLMTKSRPGVWELARPGRGQPTGAM
jgi:hypothetical protein